MDHDRLTNDAAASGKRKGAFLAYVTVLLMILASKTVFFGIMHGRVMNLVALAATSVLFLTRQKVFALKARKLGVLVIFFVILFVVSLAHMQDIVRDINGYIGALAEIIEIFLIGLLATAAFSRKEFVKCYVHILFVICCISLAYFFLTIANRGAIMQMTNIYDSGTTKYVALPWYTFGWRTAAGYDYIFGRNAGMWWEPGAFQGFIIIGLLMVLNDKKTFKRTTPLVIVFLLALLTTQSTMGYIVLLISLIAYSKEYVECLFGATGLAERNKGARVVVYCLALLFAAFIAYIIMYTGNISEKLNAVDGSYQSRSEDVFSSLRLVAYNPLAGIGLGATGEQIRKALVATVSTTTILHLASVFGALFAIYYCYRFAKGCFSTFHPDNALKKLVVLAIFVMVLMGETLYLLPVYAVFLFTWEEDGSPAGIRDSRA